MRTWTSVSGGLPSRLLALKCTMLRAATFPDHTSLWLLAWVRPSVSPLLPSASATGCGTRPALSPTPAPLRMLVLGTKCARRPPTHPTPMPLHPFTPQQVGVAGGDVRSGCHPPAARPLRTRRAVQGGAAPHPLHRQVPRQPSASSARPAALRCATSRCRRRRCPWTGHSTLRALSPTAGAPQPWAALWCPCGSAGQAQGLCDEIEERLSALWGDLERLRRRAVDLACCDASCAVEAAALEVIRTQVTAPSRPPSRPPAPAPSFFAPSRSVAALGGGPSEGTRVRRARRPLSSSLCLCPALSCMPTSRCRASRAAGGCGCGCPGSRHPGPAAGAGA